jgi:hypothetical protein
VSLVTGNVVGNGIQITISPPYNRAKMLIGMPQRPSVKGPYFGCRPSSFLSNRKRIGGRYEAYNAREVRDKMAKKATEEPTLMVAKRTHKTQTRLRALMGTFNWGCTCECQKGLEKL